MFKEGLAKNPSEGINSLEKKANYEGDHTLLLLSRLNNDGVKNKLLESIVRQHISFYPQNISLEQVDKIRKQEEINLNERIKEVFQSTQVGFNEKKVGSGGFGQTGTVCSFAKSIEDHSYSQKQLNIIEAHEKGHGIRTFSVKSPITDWIKSGFDFSKISFAPEELGMELGQEQKQIIQDRIRFHFITESEGREEKNELLKGVAKDYFETCDELVERMSQLKNYFCMNGDDNFTQKHLEYARKNYIKDTGFKRQMGPFFDAITKKTEKNFLDVINNLGV